MRCCAGRKNNVVLVVMNGLTVSPLKGHAPARKAFWYFGTWYEAKQRGKRAKSRKTQQDRQSRDVVRSRDGPFPALGKNVVAAARRSSANASRIKLGPATKIFPLDIFALDRVIGRVDHKEKL